MSDEVLLIFCYFIYWITLLFLVLASEQKWRVFLINLAFQACYSIYLYYNLKNNSEGGGALAWWFLWMFSLGVHWVISLVLLIIRESKNQ